MTADTAMPNYCLELTLHDSGNSLLHQQPSISFSTDSQSSLRPNLHENENIIHPLCTSSLPRASTAIDISLSSEDTMIESHHQLLQDIAKILRYDSANPNIVLINARSAVNKMTYIQSLLLISQPTALMITEAWCTSEINDDFFHCEGYSFFRKNRSVGRGGGCIIYVKSDCRAVHYDDPKLNICDTLWVALYINKQQTLLLGCIYRPPNHDSELPSEITAAFHYTSKLNFTYKVIGGDFNMPEVSWEPISAPPRYSKFLDAVELCGWTQSILRPTRNHNILDLVFLKDIALSTIDISQPFPGSDHNTIICTLDTKLHSSKCSALRKTFMCFGKARWDVSNSFIRSLN